jgi:hypothetical protein
MNLRTFTALALVVAIPVLPIACGGGNDNLPPPPPPPAPHASASASASVAVPVADAAPPPPAAPPVQLLMGTASPDPVAPLPSVKFSAPTSGQVVAADKANDFQIKLDVKNWQTATGSSHVHLILDNKPYKAIYDPKQPIKLSELTGGGAIDEGQHVLVAFPSRANHESVKTKDAISVVEFFVGKKADGKTNLKKPLFVYSRPKGEYKGDMARHVLIDFQLANDTLGDGKDHVSIAVTGPGLDAPLTAKADKVGTPFYLDNLQNGSYTLKLDLMDKDDKPVAGPWNSTTRTIKVDKDAQADAMPGMAMPAATGSGTVDAGVDAAKPAKK